MKKTAVPNGRRRRRLNFCPYPVDLEHFLAKERQLTEQNELPGVHAKHCETLRYFIRLARIGEAALAQSAPARKPAAAKARGDAQASA